MNQNRYIYRKAEPKDYETIWPLIAKAATSLTDHSEPEQVKTYQESIAKAAESYGGYAAFTQACVDKGEVFFVCYDDDKMVGVSSFFRKDPNKGPQKSPNVRSISIDPEYQGRGIGKQLFTILEEFAKQNHPDLRMLTAQSSLNAVGFFDQLGFKVYQERGEDGYDKSGAFEEVWMVKPLKIHLEKGAQPSQEL